MVSGILDTDYVLCVGTIEVRKNPSYLFNIWKMMVQSGRPNIPSLVFVGRKGWLVQDFLDQLKGCNNLGGRIFVMHNVTDVELDLLYRKCMLTMFPSFIEGWGLPVGESLAHGKICLCSAAGGIPEVGGEFVDFIDPYNPSDGLDHLVRYLDDPEQRLNREREIAEHFQPRSWREAADDVTAFYSRPGPPDRPVRGVAAILLPPRPVSASGQRGGGPLDGRDGSGGIGGTGLRLRLEDPGSLWRTGGRASNHDPISRRCPGRRQDQSCDGIGGARAAFPHPIRSGSGSETEASLAAGSEKLAVLSCEVEPGKLVTAHLVPWWRDARRIRIVSGLDLTGRLKRILYFDPKHVAAKALQDADGSPPNGQATLPPQQEAGADRRSQESVEDARHTDLIAIRPQMDDSRRATSFGAFLQTTDSFWPSDSPVIGSADFRRPRRPALILFRLRKEGDTPLAENPRFASIRPAQRSICGDVPIRGRFDFRPLRRMAGHSVT